MRLKSWQPRDVVFSMCAVAVSLAGLTFAAPAALAASPPATVDSVTVQQAESPFLRTTLKITFSKPVSEQEAAAVKKRIDTAQPAGTARPQQFPDTRLTCGHSIDRSDSNGFLTLQYQCFPTYAATNWGYRISPADQATVSGVVREHGWTWFRNGGPRQPLGAPHTVGLPYLFHGTMQPMYNGDTINYQDYFTWASNVYPGSTASLAIAGTLRLG